MSVDISHVAAAGDQLVAAAMLCTWAYGFGMVDAAAVLAEHGLAPRRQYLGVMDELWRALRGAPGLVDHADALTRLNRANAAWPRVMVTHSLADLDALPTEEDRAKARGFVERAAIKILGRAAGPGTGPHQPRSPGSPRRNGTWSPPGPHRKPGSRRRATPAAANI